MELTTLGVAGSLKSISENSINNGFAPTTILSNDLVMKLLSFSDQQKKEFEKIEIRITDEMRFGSDGEIKKMEDALKRHWEKILSTLDLKQNKVAKDLVGEPIQWFRYSGNNPLRSRDFSRRNGPIVNPGTIDMAIRTDDGRSILLMTPTELEDRGIGFTHSHTYEMMTSRFVWDELELSNEQRKELKHHKLRSVALPAYYQDRTRELLNQEKVDYPKSLKSILTKDQMTWFQQMELQVLTGKYESSVGLLHPGFIERLDLRSNQQDKINSLAKKYVQDIQVLDKSLKASREATRLKYKEEIQGILTEEQKVIFRKLVKKQSDKAVR